MSKLEKLKNKATEVHEGKYDYSLWTSYGGTAKDYHIKNVQVLCPLHGLFLTSVANHIRGSGCPECGRIRAASKTRKDASYFIKKASQVHGDLYDYSQWTEVSNTSKDKVKIICKEHGPFFQTPASHIDKKAGCPSCAQSRRKRTCIERYGTNHYAQRNLTDEALSLLDDKQWLLKQHITLKKSIPEIAFELKVSESLVTSRMKHFGIKVYRYASSFAEKEILNFIQSVGVSYIQHDREILDGLELDIFLPDFRIAIEYNGLYWHSEQNGKGPEYHLTKTEKCEEKNIRLIQIFADEWRDSRDKCKETILHLLGKSQPGTYARKTSIKEISWPQAKPFLDKYHLLNAGHPGNYRIGAFDGDELIGVMVFGNPNNEHSNNNLVELRRFVTNKKNNPGLGSKMFKWACISRGYDHVIAFVDRRWFTGLVKSHIGFQLIGKTKPTVWWTNGKDRFHRRFVTKKTLLKEYQFDSNMSKREMLNTLGFFRVWDCGKLKLEWKRDL